MAAAVWREIDEPPSESMSFSDLKLLLAAVSHQCHRRHNINAAAAAGHHLSASPNGVSETNEPAVHSKQRGPLGSDISTNYRLCT